ncbi:hypothetical protein [Oceanobacillus jeddahense]|uniref:Spore coat protein n=1 Tax=Oceanobacillus jeddahense TaxID=1462527 RepID=A0ABY5JNL3_9BACI|nr:hypothetical protein [Oceanobacillus jeddahense]UUI01892.1 hypothetical protein NP439_17835 [Oceanobacillus jeddahense]
MAYISLLFLALFFAPAEAASNDAMLIHTYEEDVTGDGEKEQLELKGKLFAADGVYYQDIWVDISSPSSDKTWRINYGGGYDPELQFADLTHNGVVDILYQSPTGGSGGLYTSQLNQWDKDDFIELPLPIEQPVQGEFMDDFRVSVQLLPKEDPIILDVSGQKEEYIRLKLYNDQGKLLEPTTLMIDPVAFFDIINLDGENQKGLKSFQQISGAYHADGIGTVESIWVYDDDKWMLLETNLQTDLPRLDSTSS